MVFFLVTALLSGLVILVGASLLGWLVRKIAARNVAGLGHVAITVAIVSVTTMAYVWVMTRPSVVGPYEQWTFQNIGGQIIGGVLAAGVMLWNGRAVES